MSASASGIITLLVVVFIGPLYYFGKHMMNKSNGTDNTVETTESGGERETMDTSHYLFALIGYAIGVGNIWRFPYVIAQNGGASALIAYIVCAILVAVPLFLYEMIVGQHVKLSTIHCYEKIRPRWQSLGVASGCMLFLFLTYYGMVVAYSLPYIWGSLETPLPWAEEGAENYWRGILNSYDDPNQASGLGGMQMNLVICLFIFWGVVFMTVGFGREVLAKITYVTVLLPVLMITLLVLRTIFLEGAMDGIKFYIGKFEAKYLFNVRTWAAACGQILFSLSPGFGTAITYSSYAKPKEDVYKACMTVAITNSLFSIVGGLAVFSMVGHMAHEENLEVEEIATRDGMGLAFITMAEAMQYFGSFSNVMSVLFFSMLFLLGLDSAYALEQTFTSYVVDFFEDRGWPSPSRWKVSMIACAVCATFGLIYTTRLGHDLLNVVDHFVASIFLLYVAFMEQIMFIFDFGYQRLEFALAKATFDNAATPDGRKLSPGPLCKLDFYITVPALSGLLAVYLIINDAIDGYNDYPKKLVTVGWVMLSFLFVTSLATLWKKDPTRLEDFDEEDIKMRDDPTPAQTPDEDDMLTPEIQVVANTNLSNQAV